MRRSLLEAIALLLVSVILGWGAGAWRRPPIPARLPAAFFQLESGARPLLLGQVRMLHRKGGSVFVDLRRESDFRAGHIPGAISLPVEEWRDLLPLAGDWIEGVPLVLYGSSQDVNAADNVAGALSKEGYAPVSVLVEGYEAWVLAGQPVDRSEAGILREPSAEEGSPSGPFEGDE